MLVLRAIVAVLRAVFTTRAGLRVENLSLRQQINVLRRRMRQPKLQSQDRIFWLWLARTWIRHQNPADRAGSGFW
jgi:hypothetical protein